jgi:hypothetical protein
MSLDCSGAAKMAPWMPDLRAKARDLFRLSGSVAHNVMATKATSRAAVILRTHHDILHGHDGRTARADRKVLTFWGDHPRKSKLLADWHP